MITTYTQKLIDEHPVVNASLQKQREIQSKRDNLYWNFRYRKDSYKARKCGLQPILIMAKGNGDKIRVYGEAGKLIEPKRLQFATARFRAWGQKERELKRLNRKVVK